MRAYYDPVADCAPPRNCCSVAVLISVQAAQNSQIMRKLILVLLTAAALLAAGGCVYQAALSQGNFLKQEELDQIEVGMTRNQVRFLLGTPMIDDPFHQDRWDYIYFLRIGRKDATFKRWVSIYFVENNVSEMVDGQELRPDL
jgi:outer membrane protein assembly factor BamE